MNTLQAESPDDMLTVTEVCAMLRVGRKSIYDLASRGSLPFVRVGNLYRFLRSDVEDFIASGGEQ